MQTLLIIIHVLVCLFLIVIVLLQHGKGADMGASFGGSSQTVFGTEGPLPLLNKITTGAAIVFMVTSVLLAYISSNTGNGTVMQEVQTPAQSAPVSIPLPPAGGVPPAPVK
ncbi:MAG TPA: preprotein translocase subunit SecG [Desulfurivibrionaceae bacterium]|nr:preprotein translocase subunit SecG [Desulfurivibrionaceae bacterium]